MYLNYLYFNVYKWACTRKIIGKMLTNTIVIQRCWWQSCRAFNCRILYDHYLPTVIPIVILNIIGIPSPTHSFTLGLNPSFSANPPYPSLSLFLIQVSLYGFPRLFTLLLSISVFLLFSFSVFTLFSCRFRAVD